jgi:hypothetical protein
MNPRRGLRECPIHRLATRPNTAAKRAGRHKYIWVHGPRRSVADEVCDEVWSTKCELRALPTLRPTLSRLRFVQPLICYTARVVCGAANTYPLRRSAPGRSPFAPVPSGADGHLRGEHQSQTEHAVVVHVPRYGISGGAAEAAWRSSYATATDDLLSRT